MAGTITQTVSTTGGSIGVITLTCTGDASDGSFPSTAITHKFSGWLLALETNPGATAPSANYDIAITDADGVDVLNGAGANRHTSTSEKAFVYMSVGATPYSIHPVVDISDTLTVAITNNSVNSAIIVIKLYFQDSK